VISRRVFLRTAAGAPLIAITAQNWLPASFGAELKSMTGDAKPISVEERRTRITKLQMLMGQRKVQALLVEPGSTLDYFTGKCGVVPSASRSRSFPFAVRSSS
jgi:Xaa-Pro dipeptidase